MKLLGRFASEVPFCLSFKGKLDGFGGPAHIKKQEGLDWRLYGVLSILFSHVMRKKVGRKTHGKWSVAYDRKQHTFS